MVDVSFLHALLRALIYVGTVSAAGSILYALTFPLSAGVLTGPLRRQMWIGCVLLLLIEPVRYLTFQLAISGGDFGLAFSPGLRWMGLQTAVGHAAIVRFGAALVLLGFSHKSRLVAVFAATAMIGSYLLEGHTTSNGGSVVYSGLLVAHLAIVHWWLGALYPLASLARLDSRPVLTRGLDAFSNAAIWAVPILIAAGTILVAFLTGFKLDLDMAYQQRFFVKLGIVVIILAIAAKNKFVITPLITHDLAHGARALRSSIITEMIVAGAILLATAWMLQSGPAD